MVEVAAWYTQGEERGSVGTREGRGMRFLWLCGLSSYRSRLPGGAGELPLTNMTFLKIRDTAVILRTSLEMCNLRQARHVTVGAISCGTEEQQIIPNISLPHPSNGAHRGASSPKLLISHTLVATNGADICALGRLLKELSRHYAYISSGQYLRR